MPSITLLYASVLTIVLLILSGRIVGLRRRHRVGLGTGSIGALERAVRAQANFIEYVPMALVMLALLEYAAAPVALIHALGLALLLGRVLHGLGLSSSGGLSTGRFVGTLLTWLMLLVAALIGGVLFALQRLG